MDSAFYADARHLWYCDPMAYANMVLVQSLEPGISMQGWRPFSSDGVPLLRCADTVWAVADIDYPNGGNIPDEVNYPKKRNTQSNVKSVLHAIQSQGGIPVWEKRYNFEYLRPTRVEGTSFVHVKDRLFEDSKSVYVQTKRGLIHLEGALPRMTTFLGDLSCNNGRIFRYGCEILQHVDAASLRYIGDELYADKDHVYLLRHDMEGSDYCPNLHILDDAQPANFRIIRTMGNDILVGDEKQVWLNGEIIHGLIPGALRFIGSYFWTDENQVYYCAEVIPDADPNEFEVLANSGYARQRATVYFGARQIPGADAATFVAYGWTSACDRYGRYDLGRAVDDPGQEVER